MSAYTSPQRVVDDFRVSGGISGLKTDGGSFGVFGGGRWRDGLRKREGRGFKVIVCS